MRRIFAALSATGAILLVGATGSTANDATAPSVTSASKAEQKAWVRWAFGSASNPLGSALCGETRQGDFLLNAAASKRSRFHCEVPAGTEIVATPGGDVAWRPLVSGSLTNAVRSRLRALSNPKVTLDGVRLHGVHDTLRTTRAYRISVHRRSLIAGATPEAVPYTRIASGGWFLRIGPLAVGSHELRLRDRVGGQKLSATYEIEVVSAG